LAQLVQLKRVLMSCLEDWGLGSLGPPLATPLMHLPVITCRLSGCPKPHQTFCPSFCMFVRMSCIRAFNSKTKDE